MTPQKAKNHTLENLVESEGDDSLVAEVRRMMIKMFNNLKEEFREYIQNQLN
jgi:hypothetical protein